MELIRVFETLLVVAMIGGIFVCGDRRSGRDRRTRCRGGRRAADGATAKVAEPATG